MTSGKRLTAAAVAARLGVSAKALRVYEARGLVAPERTAAGWRVYGPDAIARLHQLLALKGFGLPLGRIAELMAGGPADLAAFLAAHERALAARLDETARALKLVGAARAALDGGRRLSADDLIELTKETAMTNVNDALFDAYERAAANHLSPADRATLAANGGASMAMPDADWAALNAEAAALMRTHAPDTPEAIDLARRWMTKVFAATGGDPGLTRRVRDAAAETLAAPAFRAAAPGALDAMAYVRAAYGAAIAAGVMPAPESPDATTR